MGRSLISKLARRAGARPSVFRRREFLLSNRAAGAALVLADRQHQGGRVHSFNSLLPGEKVETGWQFIGLNHPTCLAHAKQFGLDLNELPEGEEADSPILINGRALLVRKWPNCGSFSIRCNRA